MFRIYCSYYVAEYLKKQKKNNYKSGASKRLLKPEQ